MSQSQQEVDPELEQWANYHDLDDILYGESKNTWPQKNSALHAGDLEATPKKGTRANRPSTAPRGALYRATDESRLYQYIEGEWRTVGGAGAHVHDVTAYGAVGDGQTDDSGAIQAATDAAWAFAERSTEG